MAQPKDNWPPMGKTGILFLLWELHFQLGNFETVLRITPNRLTIGPDRQQKSAYNCFNFLTHRIQHIFWCSKDPPHRESSFEYPQCMFCFRNKKNNFQIRRHGSLGIIFSKFYSLF